MAGVDQVTQSLRDLSEEDRRKVLGQLDLKDRIVVETSNRPTPRKLRLFSGKVPFPSGEVDFETWDLLVCQLVKDGSVSEEDKKQAIFQNLLRPALDTVKSASGTVKELLGVLRQVYGSVVDGKELLIRFHTAYQSEKESASTYLQRLYNMVSEASDRDGAKADDIPSLLLAQFLRGSSDEALISRLKLEDKVDSPPSFPDLLWSIRKEESRAQEKKLRLKAAGRVASITESSGLVSELKEKISQLEAQVKRMNTGSEASGSSNQDHRPQSGSERRSGGWQSRGGQSRGGRQNFGPRFCYRCGEDGHHLQDCSNPKNPGLVQEKLERRCAVDPKA